MDGMEKGTLHRGSAPLMVWEIPKEEAVAFIRLWHYSKVMPRINKHYLGFYEGESLAGVIVLGWGTQPLQSIRKMFPRHGLTTTDYLEIGKMCFVPSKNKNRQFGSQVLSLLVKWMKAHTDCLFLYTLADGIMGKCGYVYQAANFRYIGKFRTSVYRCRITGEKIHPRSARVLLEENARFDGVEKRFWLTHAFCEYRGIEKINGRMFRYLYPLSPQAKELLMDYPEYAALSYPKEKDLCFAVRVAPGQYVPISQPEFARDVCRFNTQRY